jgi:hypothetical protein
MLRFYYNVYVPFHCSRIFSTVVQPTTQENQYGIAIAVQIRMRCIFRSNGRKQYATHPKRANRRKKLRLRPPGSQPTHERKMWHITPTEWFRSSFFLAGITECTRNIDRRRNFFLRPISHFLLSLVHTIILHIDVIEWRKPIFFSSVFWNVMSEPKSTTQMQVVVLGWKKQT